MHTAEYVSSAHWWVTLGCSGRGGWALNTYSSANSMIVVSRNLHHSIFSTIISYHPSELNL